MIILVDYDNIEKDLTKLGITYVVNSIISKIDPAELGEGNRHVTIRLYGGWYQNTRFTNRAQGLSAEISRSFPATSYLSDKKTAAIVKCELAYSLLADPTNHLFHTYRQKRELEGLRAEHPGFRGCKQMVCPIVASYNFVTNGICSQCNKIKPTDIFYRDEQKLIDTMLTSDLIFSSRQPNDLCIVSSDDDFWPGIITTLRSGSRVIHLHTKPGGGTPIFYSRNAGTSYVQRHL